LRYKSAKWESKAPRVGGGGTREGEEKQKLPGHGRGPERLSHDSCVYKSFYLVFGGTLLGQTLKGPGYRELSDRWAPNLFLLGFWHAFFSLTP
jgi:hypothetical protein